MGENTNTVSSLLFFVEETLSIQEKVTETQPMELCRLSSMKSYQQWLVDCDCLLEGVDPTVRP